MGAVVIYKVSEAVALRGVMSGRQSAAVQQREA
jgi:hypothetical protein